MVEATGRRCPLDQRKVLAVVLGVTLRAALARVKRQLVGGVQAPVRFQARGDFGVALKAFQFALAANLVTRRAMRRAFQSLVRFGERTGRNLGRRASRQQNHDANCGAAQRSKTEGPTAVASIGKHFRTSQVRTRCRHVAQVCTAHLVFTDTHPRMLVSWQVNEWSLAREIPDVSHQKCTVRAHAFPN